MSFNESVYREGSLATLVVHCFSLEKIKLGSLSLWRIQIRSAIGCANDLIAFEIHVLAYHRTPKQDQVLRPSRYHDPISEAVLIR